MTSVQSRFCKPRMILEYAPATKIMIRVRLATACIAFALVASSSRLEAAGRMRGSVVDPDGRPVSDVRVTVTTKQLPTFHQVVTTNDKGVFTLGFSQGGLRYTYVLEKEGYETLEVETRGTANQSQRKTFVLVPTVRQAPPVQQISTEDEAILAYNEGLQAARNGDLKTAEASFARSIEKDEGLLPAYSALARVYFDGKDFAAAAATAEKALARVATDAEALRVSYDAYRALGEEDKAAGAAQALKAAEKGVDAAAILYNDGADAYSAGDLDTALAKFQEAATLDPSLTEAHYAIANMQLRNRNFAAAATAAENGLKVKAADRQLLAAAHDAYSGLGEVEKARAVLLRLGAVDPQVSVPSLLAQGAELFNAGRIEEAREILENVLSIDPTAASAHYLLGLYYVGKDDSVAAREHLLRFIEAAPDDPEAPTAREMLRYLE